MIAQLKHLILLASFIALSISCKTYHHPNEILHENYNMNTASAVSDSAMNSIIQPFKERMGESLDEVIGHCSETLKLDVPESPMGNFLGDALLKKANDYYTLPIDFAILNYGGIRLNELIEGPITKRKIYEIMPFENRIVILELDSTSIYYLTNHIAKREGWPSSGSLRFEILNHRAVNIRINGEKLNSKRTYRIALPDYIANGGDKCIIPKATNRVDLKELVREAFFDYIRELTAKGNPVNSKIDGRIVFLFE